MKTVTIEIKTNNAPSIGADGYFTATQLANLLGAEVKPGQNEWIIAKDGKAIGSVKSNCP